MVMVPDFGPNVDGWKRRRRDRAIVPSGTRIPLSSSRPLRASKRRHLSIGSVEHHVCQAVRNFRLAEETFHEAMWVVNQGEQIEAQRQPAVVRTTVIPRMR